MNFCKTHEIIRNQKKKENIVDEIFEPKEKQKNFTIRMDITMDKEMYLDEAETVIFNALRSAGMKSHRGGIS